MSRLPRIDFKDANESTLFVLQETRKLVQGNYLAFICLSLIDVGHMGRYFYADKDTWDEAKKLRGKVMEALFPFSSVKPYLVNKEGEFIDTCEANAARLEWLDEMIADVKSRLGVEP